MPRKRKQTGEPGAMPEAVLVRMECLVQLAEERVPPLMREDVVGLALEAVAHSILSSRAPRTRPLSNDDTSLSAMMAVDWALAEAPGFLRDGGFHPAANVHLQPEDLRVYANSRFSWWLGGPRIDALDARLKVLTSLVGYPEAQQTEEWSRFMETREGVLSELHAHFVPNHLSAEFLRTIRRCGVSEKDDAEAVLLELIAQGLEGTAPPLLFIGRDGEEHLNARWIRDEVQRLLRKGVIHRSAEAGTISSADSVDVLAGLPGREADPSDVSELGDSADLASAVIAARMGRPSKSKAVRVVRQNLRNLLLGGVKAADLARREGVDKANLSRALADEKAAVKEVLSRKAPRGR